MGQEAIKGENNFFQFVFCKGFKAGLNEIAGIFEVLQVIMLSALDPVGNCFQIVKAMKLANQSCPKLIFDMVFKQKREAFLNFGEEFLAAWKINGSAIFCRTVIDIHCDKGDQLAISDLFFILSMNSGRSFWSSGSPPVMQTPSNQPRRFSRKVKKSASEIIGGSLVFRTRDALWHQGQRKLQPVVKTVAAILPG